MPKLKWFSRFKTGLVEGSTVRSVTRVVERKGARKKKFLLKRLIRHKIVGATEQKRTLHYWRLVHEKLRSLKIPTVPSFEVIPGKNEVLLKQKDFSKTGKAIVFDAWRKATLEKLRSGKFNRSLLGIARDLALMNKAGLALGANEQILAPWIFYRKPNGKLDRAVIDFGSIYFSASQRAIAAGTERNFVAFLGVLKKTQNHSFMRAAVRKYFQENPKAREIETLSLLAAEL